MKILVVDDEVDVQPMFLQRFRHEIKHMLFGNKAIKEKGLLGRQGQRWAI